MSEHGNLRHVGVVTSARSDFGLLQPLIERLRDDPGFRLTIFATGMHFSHRQGRTIDEIRQAGLGEHLVEVAAEATDTDGTDMAAAMAAGLRGFARTLGERRPDILVVMGDRFDMFPAVLAAMSGHLPVAHISGGELSEGAVDDMISQATTKMSHVHFVSHAVFAQRLRQMGEEDWRITLSGEPGLDNIRGFPNVSRDDLFTELDLAPDRPVSVFTFHPETLRPDDSGAAIATILQAAARIDSAFVLTYPNGDPGSDAIIEAIEAFAVGRADCQVRRSLGRTRYLNLLAYADCMVGNSSSGIVEAASFRLPVVNLGDRQTGRIMPANVISAAIEPKAVESAWRTALSPAFRSTLAGLDNPYGDGRAAECIVDRLKAVDLGPKLLHKVFANPEAHVPEDCR